MASGPGRGLALPLVATLAMVGLLVGLGLWQLERRVEKHALIAQLAGRVGAPAVELPAPSTWATLTPTQDEFRYVELTATFDPAETAFVYTTGSTLRPDAKGLGVWVFARGRLPSGDYVVVNRGFVPEEMRAKDRVNGAPERISLTGYLRFPERAGYFTPKPDRAKRLWFLRDQREIASALNWGTVAPFYIDQEGPVPQEGRPKPGKLAIALPDNHMQYALTWFSLAGIIVILFGFWLGGRLRAP